MEHSFFSDRAKVEVVARQILPGARAPAGYRPFIGMELGEGIVTLALGDRGVPARRKVVEQDGVPAVQDTVLFANPADRTVFLLFHQPDEKALEEAAKQFGAGLDLEGYRALKQLCHDGR